MENHKSYRRGGKKRINVKRLLVSCIVLLAIIAAVLFIIYILKQNEQPLENSTTEQTSQDIKVSQEPGSTVLTREFLTPNAAVSTEPSNLSFKTEIELDGTETTQYQRLTEILLGYPEDYSSVEGITTFRGNNFRNSGSYGTATITEKKLDIDNAWTVSTGSLPKSTGSGAWTGNGWVGQPLIVKWDDETKQIMNLYDAKKSKSDLVEVIYASMDGNVYFLDLDDGSKTRDKLNIGLPFKGAGSIDPRGYPLLYLGSGDALPSGDGATRAMIYSLIDFKQLYVFGKKTDSFSLRGFHAYDSSPLIDSDTDTLIYPGENGIIYTMNLNTDYDKAAGTISVEPSELLKWRYSNSRSNKDTYWLGMEDSCVMWKNYMYIADNGGNLMCIDINTMDLIWVQDTKDDTNGSPVFELSEDGERGYIYIAPSLHWTKDSNNYGEISIYKIDAVTGEVVWNAPYNVYTYEGVSGGVQATAVLGQNSISDLIIIPIARTPSMNSGCLVALDKETGKEVWKYSMNNYAWSSPVAVYDEDGNAYIIQCDSAGNMALIDGKTGTELDKVSLGTNIEATPAVYGNTVVVGTRGQKIYGITIK
ncbi:MAG: PQQ-binding-like beta-propeller repeat protein [Eubacteriales bacterium]